MMAPNWETTFSRLPGTPFGGFGSSNFQERDVKLPLVGGGFNPIENISQNGNLPQIGMKIRNVGNHHLVPVLYFFWESFNPYDAKLQHLPTTSKQHLVEGSTGTSSSKHLP